MPVRNTLTFHSDQITDDNFKDVQRERDDHPLSREGKMQLERENGSATLTVTPDHMFNEQLISTYVRHHLGQFGFAESQEENPQPIQEL